MNTMISKLGRWFERYPLVRDTLIWVIPALVFGLVLRLMILSYSPYAYWGSDSRSYFGLSNGVFTEFYFSINEKRRYLYPIFAFLVTLLPGSTLRALAWIQMGLGLATVVAFAYTIRRVFVSWKWSIIPLTLIYAGLPMFLWYEHEFLAETIYFDCVVWCVAGWVAWVSQRDPARARRLWWVFFVPLAIMVLTKPSVKFFWPGIVIALVVVLAWKVLRWKEWTALGVLFLAGLTVGDEDQSAWLLYTTVFPMTQVDTPLHADYKAEIRDWVLEKRAHLMLYDEQDDEVHDFLREPESQNERPLWRDLAKRDEKALEELYHNLAFEAIWARPDLFLYVALQRLSGSINLDEFEEDRFLPTYFADRFDQQLRDNRNPESMVRIAFALPKDGPLPSREQFYKWLAPHPDSAAGKWMMNYVQTYQRYGELLKRPAGQNIELDRNRLTFLGWWALLGGLIALIPPFTRTLGVWVVTFAGAMIATYLVGIENERYFLPAWPLIYLLLGAAVDGIVRSGLRITRPSKTT